jgi:hypothetical protein
MAHLPDQCVRVPVRILYLDGVGLHESIHLFKDGCQLFGGICFRPEFVPGDMEGIRVPG